MSRNSPGLPLRPAPVPLQTTRDRAPSSKPYFQSSTLQGAHDFRLDGVNFNTVNGDQHNNHNNDHSSTVNSNNRYGRNSNNHYSDIENSTISNGDVINSTNNSTIPNDYGYNRHINRDNRAVRGRRTQDRNRTSNVQDSSLRGGDMNYNDTRRNRNQRDNGAYRPNSPGHNYMMNRNDGSRDEVRAGHGARSHYDHSGVPYTSDSPEEHERYGNPSRVVHQQQSVHHLHPGRYNEQRQGDVPALSERGSYRDREHEARDGHGYYEEHSYDEGKNDQGWNTYPTEAPYAPSNPSIDNTHYPPPSPPPSYFRPSGGFSQPQSHRSSFHPESVSASYVRSAASLPPPSRFPTSGPGLSPLSNRDRSGNFHDQVDQPAGKIPRSLFAPQRGQQGSSAPTAFTEVHYDNDEPAISYPPVTTVLRLMDHNDKYKTMQSFYACLCENGFRSVNAVAVATPEHLEAIGIPGDRIKELLELCLNYTRRAEKAATGC